MYTSRAPWWFFSALLAGLTAGQQPARAQTARIVKVERTLCVGSVLGMNRDGSSYAWNCRGMPMIRLTLDDGSVLGPLIGVTVDTVGDPLTWQTIPVDVLKTGAAQPSPARSTTASGSGAHVSDRDPFTAGLPFSMDDVLQRVGIIADRRLAMAIAARGVSFVPGDTEFQRLRRAGAAVEVIQAVAEAKRLPPR
jgi:hypothetical protein